MENDTNGKGVRSFAFVVMFPAVKRIQFVLLQRNTERALKQVRKGEIETQRMSTRGFIQVAFVFSLVDQMFSKQNIRCFPNKMLPFPSVMNELFQLVRSLCRNSGNESVFSLRDILHHAY